MGTFTGLDLIVLALYMAVLVVIGYVMMKRVHNSNDFFIAGRSLGSFTLTATVCATLIGGGSLIGRGGMIYNQGMVATLVAIPYLIGMYFFSLFAGRIQRVGERNNISSIPGLMEYRFGKGVKYVVAAMVCFGMMGTLATQISATATIARFVGGDLGISYQMGAVIATIIFIAYTGMSGFFGVVYTDVFQFFILIIFVFTLLPILSVVQAGGWHAFVGAIPKNMLTLKPDATLIGYIFTNLVVTIASAEYWQRAFAAKTPKTARKGLFWGTTIYGLSIPVTTVIGLCAFVLLPDLLAHYNTADAAIPALVISILPAGLTGLTFAGLLSVLMSTSDSILLVATQTLVGDIVMTVKPNTPDRTEMRYNRLATVLIAFGSLMMALYFKSAYEVLMFAWSFYAAAVGLPALASLYWKKATKYGILAGILAGSVVTVAWNRLGEPFGVGASIPGSVCCGIALVAVSLATCRACPSRMPEL